MKQEKNKLNEPKQPQAQQVSAAKPATQKTTSAPVQAATQSSATQEKAVPHRGHKKWLVLLLVFFLFGAVLIVPAQYVPGLSNLLQRLGLSAQESQQTSVGRALQAWLGGEESSLFGPRKQDGDNGSEDAEPVRSVFDTQKGADRFAAAKADGGFDEPTALFNLRAVNTSKRARGEAIDAMVGAAFISQDGDETQRAALLRVPLGWSDEAKALQDEKNMQEVYFGADADVQARAAFDRENIQSNSVATGKMFAQAGIVGVAPVKWFEVPIGQAAGLREMVKQKVNEKAVEKSTGLVNFSAQFTAGTKPEKDLAYAWLFTTMAEDAKQLMLKKQLTGAGYMAMDVPSKIYDVEGNASGLALNPSKVAVTVDLENKQLLSDEQCRDKMLEAGDRMWNVLQLSKPQIKNMIEMFDKVQYCEADPTLPGGNIDKWLSYIGEGPIKTDGNLVVQCKEMDGIFHFMYDGCKLNTMPEKGDCQASPREGYSLKDYAENLKAACGEIYKSSQQYQKAYTKFTSERKNLEDDVDKAHKKHDALVDQYNEKEIQLRAEEAKPAEEQNVELIQQLTGELSELKEKQIPLAKEAWDKAVDNLEEAKGDFKKAMDDVNNEIYTVYGSKGGKNDYDKVRQPPQGIEKTECDVPDEAALVNQLTQEDVIASFNFAVDGKYRKQAEDAGKPFETWHRFFSTVQGSVEAASSDNAAGKGVLLELLEKRK